MKTGFLLRNLTLGAAFAALAFSAPAAKANLRDFKFLNLGDGQNVSISHDNGVNYQGTFAGRYNGELEKVSSPGNYDAVKIFCVDASHSVGVPDSFSTLVDLGLVTQAPGTLTQESNSKYYYEIPGGGLPGDPGAGLQSALHANDYNPAFASGSLTAAERAQATAYIVDTYLIGSYSNQTLAAAQLAIWDIVQDGGDGQGTGSFRSNASGGLLTDVASILTTATSSLNLVDNNRAIWIQAGRVAGTGGNNTPGGVGGGHKQDFAFRSTNAIPEPAFYQLSALILMGGSGLFLRRRKK